MLSALSPMLLTADDSGLCSEGGLCSETTLLCGKDGLSELSFFGLPVRKNAAVRAAAITIAAIIVLICFLGNADTDILLSGSME